MIDFRFFFQYKLIKCDYIIIYILYTYYVYNIYIIFYHNYLQLKLKKNKN